MKQVIGLICLFAVAVVADAQEYVITKHGVGSDSTKLNTAAIQNVIDKAEANGGGTIVIPKGVYLTGALFFKPKTKLLLQEGAKLKGSDNIDNYPLIPSRMEGRSIYYYAALINAYHVDSFQINGPGTIDGNGLKYWEYFWFYRDSVKNTGRSATNLEVHRPRLLFIWGCNNVTIKDVKLHNSGFWTTHLYQCNTVLIENCDIRSPFKPVKAPSTDGIDIDVCKKVTVRKCYISVNDDAVCIKGGKGPDAHLRRENGIVEDILIEDCVFGESHGTLTLGSESIHARNIVMRNCKMEHNTSILRLKMRPDTYQIYENVRIENITGKCGTIISMAPWTQFYDMFGSTEKPFAIVRNISFSNINVQCKTVGTMQGNAADTVSNILFKDITATAEKAELKTNYTGIQFNNVTVNGSPFDLTRKN
ncbi:MAG TPA: glycosyl hydrolase family 28 protein [Chitinophagaceae bacterium]|jgi:polygalacturonase|nr:glycosyl hydrolase family 28 protein [Chitinophagaceae bacterium]HMU56765.1 glycosyl hydrolase family 28 protein [Chitinophagaceae bacterium]